MRVSASKRTNEISLALFSMQLFRSYRLCLCLFSEENQCRKFRILSRFFHQTLSDRGNSLALKNHTFVQRSERTIPLTFSIFYRYSCTCWRQNNLLGCLHQIKANFIRTWQIKFLVSFRQNGNKE